MVRRYGRSLIVAIDFDIATDCTNCRGLLQLVHSICCTITTLFFFFSLSLSISLLFVGIQWTKQFQNRTVIALGETR